MTYRKCDMRWLFTALFLVLGTLSVGASSLDTGRAAAETFLRGQMGEVWDDLSSDVQQLFGSVDGLEGFRDELTTSFGYETKVLEEKVEPRDGIDAYIRTSRWSRSKSPILTELGIAPDGTVVSFMVHPQPALAESRFLDYQTRASLRLPFEGEWFVVWGGRTLEKNYHAADRAQRFAADLLIYRNGSSHGGEPQVLESYYCWDLPILAPADGTVHSVVNDLPDNPIGITDARHPTGNHVVLDLGESEFAFLGHMRERSISVQSGDRVIAGQEIGRCGNSGNTSEPHLHVHLQTTPNLSDGEGLPAFFNGYLANNEPVVRGEPQAGQIVQPAPLAAKEQ